MKDEQMIMEKMCVEYLQCSGNIFCSHGVVVKGDFQLVSSSLKTCRIARMLNTFLRITTCYSPINFNNVLANPSCLNFSLHFVLILQSLSFISTEYANHFWILFRICFFFNFYSIIFVLFCVTLSCSNE